MLLRSLFAVILFFASVSTSLALDVLKAYKFVDTNGVEKHWISVHGFINPGDDVKFLELVNQTENIHGLFISGPGGVYDSGIVIAEYVREKGLVTLVAPKSVCNSMCALISLAGKNKLMYDTSGIGLHRAYETQMDPKTNTLKRNKDGSIVVRENDSTRMLNALISYKLGTWGVNLNIVMAWNGTDPNNNNVTYLTSEVNEKYNLGYIVLEDPKK